jgi:hypothetical protein
MFNHKKLLSLVMAGAMATTLMVPAFASTANTADSTASSGLSAAATTSGNTSTDVTGNYVAIPINVSVPSSAKAQINPYGLPVTIDAVATGGSDSTISGWQIVSQPMYITNEGTVALKVSASVTAKVTGSKTGTAEMVATAPTDKTTDKQIYAQLQMVANSAALTGYTGTSTSDWKTALTDADKDLLNAAFATDSTWNSASSLTLSTDEAQSKADMVTLAKVKDPTYETDGTTVKTPAAYDKGSVALFRIAGNVTEDPEVAWTTADGFTATIAFTFKPSTTT